MSEDTFEFDTQLTTETVSYVTTGVLHSMDCRHPYVSFVMPSEVAPYAMPMEYIIKVPPTITWPYMSVGEFSVDLVVTLSADAFEVVSLDAVSPNSDLEGGF